jgi:hypothetical protein
MEKANLQWPKSAPTPSPIKVKNEVPREASPEQVAPEAYSAKAQSYSSESETLSFEDRWPR